MNRTFRSVPLISILALVFAGALAAAAEPGDPQAGQTVKTDQNAPAAGEGGMPPMSPEMQAKMEAWMKAGTPGAPHQALATLAGTWDAKAVYWMEPGAPPGESSGRAVNQMIFGGRYLQSDFSGEMGGEKFQGTNLVGYDNVSRRYQSLWVDSMSTQIMLYNGSASEDGKVLTFEGTFVDPLTGKSMPSRVVTRMIAPDKHVFEMHDQDMEGNFYKALEITYTPAAQ